LLGLKEKEMNMRRFTLTALAAALLAARAFSQTAAPPAPPAPAAPAPPAIDRQAAFDSVVAAEKAFAKLTGEKGMREGFLAFLADDSIVFDPDPANGQQVWKGRKPSPAVLEWYPVHSEVSLAGDLGFNTGPYDFRPKPADKPVAWGQFATIWKRQADGSWKAALDLGTSTPEAPAVAPALALTGPARVEESALLKVDAEAARTALLAADRALAAATQEKGSAAAYDGILTDDVRLLRVSHQPALGREAARALLAEYPMPTTWEPLGGGVARSGDLGYSYGFVKKHEEGPESPWINTSNYLRVWRREKDGPWKLAFEVLSPRPQKPKA
jgi:ketosteroid isomerase-like protein